MPRGNKASHVGSSWRLNELTEGAVTIMVGTLLQNVTACMKKDVCKTAVM